MTPHLRDLNQPEREREREREREKIDDISVPTTVLAMQ